MAWNQKHLIALRKNGLRSLRKWRKMRKNVGQLGRSYLDLRNLQERLQVLFDNNAADIDFIATQSEFSVKRKQSNEKCKSMSCVISGFDDRISQIQCDLCKLWFHMLCEGVATSDFSKTSAVRLHVSLLS